MSHVRWLTPSRLAFIAQLRAADVSFDQPLLVALARSAADDIERLCDALIEAEEIMDALEKQRG